MRWWLLFALWAVPCEAGRRKYVNTVKYDDLVIGGRVATEKEFPEVLFIRATGSRCSATVVGPKALLTAAHCARTAERVHLANLTIEAGNPQLSAVCTRHPKYRPGGRRGYDYALCKAAAVFTTRPGRIASENEAVQVGQNVLLLGYGGTIVGGGGGLDGVLRAGAARVEATETFYRKWFILKGEGALSFGDSGGPTIQMIADTETEEHVILGVNSKGDIEDTSLIAPVYKAKVRAWMALWSFQNDAKICGINGGCEQDAEPLGDPDPVEMPKARFNQDCMKTTGQIGLSLALSAALQIILAFAVNAPSNQEPDNEEPDNEPSGGVCLPCLRR